MAKKIRGAFTADAQSSAVVLGKEAEAILTGTFVATVVPEVQDSEGNWAPVAGEGFTGPTARKLAMALTRPWRLTVTAYTSGTIGYEVVQLFEFGQPPGQAPASTSDIDHILAIGRTVIFEDGARWRPSRHTDLGYPHA